MTDAMLTALYALAGSAVAVPSGYLAKDFGYAGYFVIRFLTKREERHAIDGIGSIFERLYGRELLIRDRSDDLKALWRSVVPRTKETIEKLGLLSFKKLRNSDIKKIDQLLDSELPKLRSKVHAEFEKTQEKVEA